jgi:hypothetical protein
MGSVKPKKFSGQSTAQAAFRNSSRPARASSPARAISFPAHDSHGDGQSGQAGESCQGETADSAKGLRAAESARHGAPDSAPAAALLKGWKKEDALRMHRLFLGVASRISQGQTLRRAFKGPAWWFSKPRFYRCAPSRRMRLTRGTLLRRFYAWKRGGRTPDGVALKYRSGLAKIEVAHVQKFALACLGAGICSLREAQATLKSPVASVHGFRHSLPIKQREAIIQMLAARRTAIRLEKRTRKLLEGKR